MREDGSVHSVDIPEDVDVVVFQRITHKWLANSIPMIRKSGIAVVIDIDDDLTSINPSNLAWQSLHPRNMNGITPEGRPYLHSWHNLSHACRDATLVTVTTPGLLPIYATHGRGFVLPNYLAEHYYGIPHIDSNVIGWPASLYTHPNDPDVVGSAISRLVQNGVDFRVVADREGVGRAFGLPEDPPGGGVENLFDWPTAIGQLGIGIAPLADTRFNRLKSWLKPLELSAAGVPWVGSPRDEYKRLHALGCGVLAQRPKDWYRELQQLHRDPVRRAELSEAGRAVAETKRLVDHVGSWLEAWNLALEIQRKTKKNPVSIF
jgi:hypothetical protein